jgi:hypothetical protein
MVCGPAAAAIVMAVPLMVRVPPTVVGGEVPKGATSMSAVPVVEAGVTLLATLAQRIWMSIRAPTAL